MDSVGERGIVYDARGLVEPDDAVPGVSEISGARAVFDAKDLTTRKINLELRHLLYERGITDVTVQNPGAKHSIGVGILQRCRSRSRAASATSAAASSTAPRSRSRAASAGPPART